MQELPANKTTPEQVCVRVCAHVCVCVHKEQVRKGWKRDFSKKQAIRKDNLSAGLFVLLL